MTAVTVVLAPTRLAVRTADGARAELQLFDAEDAPEALLWLPAMGIAARHYAALGEQCAAHGLACAVHEWRGLGSSNLRAGRRCDWGYAELLEDIGASLDAARAHWPRRRWLLGGHSLGGQMAVLFAARRPAAAQALVLIGCGMPYWRDFGPLARWPARAAFTLAPLLAAGIGRFPGRALGFGGNESRGVIRDWTRSARSGRYAPRQWSDAEEALAALCQPLLLLHAGDDRLVSRAAIDHLLVKMPMAPSSVRLLDPADFGTARIGHFRWMGTPAPVAAAIAAWRRPRHPPATGAPA